MGRKNKHWVELARVWCWYFEIRKRCDWSDYRLNMEFAWRAAARASAKQDKRISDRRPRTFELIRKRGLIPLRSRKSHRIDDIVNSVDNNELFRGTAAIYKSSFWDLIQDDSPTLKKADAQISELLLANGLMRSEVTREPGLAIALRKYGLPAIIDRCLLISLRRMDVFSQLSLIWLQYLLTEPASSWEIRLVIEKIADRWLEEFFVTFFPEDKSWLYDEAIKHLLTTRFNPAGLAQSGYGYFEQLGQKVIVPQELQGKLSEDLLFSRDMFCPTFSAVFNC